MPNCPACNGKSGLATESYCPFCDNVGVVSGADARKIQKRLSTTMLCPSCNGRGQTAIGGIGPAGPVQGYTGCGQCGGKGVVTIGQLHAQEKASQRLWGNCGCMIYTIALTVFAIWVTMDPSHRGAGDMMIWIPVAIGWIYLVGALSKKETPGWAMLVLPVIAFLAATRWTSNGPVMPWSQIEPAPVIADSQDPPVALCAVCKEPLAEYDSRTVDGLGTVHSRCAERGRISLEIDGWVEQYGDDTYVALDRFGALIWANGIKSDRDSVMAGFIETIRREREAEQAPVLTDEEVIDALVRSAITDDEIVNTEVRYCESWAFVHAWCTREVYDPEVERSMPVTYHLVLDKEGDGWRLHAYTTEDPGTLGQRFEGEWPQSVIDGFESWVTDWGI